MHLHKQRAYYLQLKHCASVKAGLTNNGDNGLDQDLDILGQKCCNRKFHFLLSMAIREQTKENHLSTVVYWMQ